MSGERGCSPNRRASRRAVRLPHKWNTWALPRAILGDAHVRLHVVVLFQGVPSRVPPLNFLPISRYPTISHFSTKVRLTRDRHCACGPSRAPPQLGGMELDKWQRKHALARLPVPAPVGATRLSSQGGTAGVLGWLGTYPSTLVRVELKATERPELVMPVHIMHGSNSSSKVYMVDWCPHPVLLLSSHL